MTIQERARSMWPSKLGTPWAGALRVGACVGAGAFLRSGGSWLVGGAVLALAPWLVIADKRSSATRAKAIADAYALSAWFGIYFAGERLGLSTSVRLLLCAGLLAVFLVRDGRAAWRRRAG